MNPKQPLQSLSSHALFAFFRDKSCAANLSDGRDYYAAGIVTERHNQGSVSGKDLVVTYLNPYTGYVESAWRADGEIEIYEVDEWNWNALRERYEFLEETPLRNKRCSRSITTCSIRKQTRMKQR